jgi:hypothetical protein
VFGSYIARNLNHILQCSQDVFGSFQGPSPPVSASVGPRYSGTESGRPGAPEQQMEVWSTDRVECSALTGTRTLGAETVPPDTSTSAPVVEGPPMALRSVVSRRRLSPATPLVTDQWERVLRSSRLASIYPRIPDFLRHGADAGFPPITHSFTPLNTQSTEDLSDAFVDIIQSGYNKGRYLGPFTRDELEDELGPFQSSPLSLVPKAGKPGKYRLIQNLSHPHSN